MHILSEIEFIILETDTREYMKVRRGMLYLVIPCRVTLMVIGEYLMNRKEMVFPIYSRISFIYSICIIAHEVKISFRMILCI
jgi:hypothetical protein